MKKYWTLDVFGENKYEGNQLAVFTNAHGIPEKELLSIAREINYSETSFIYPGESRGNKWKVRIFTPGGEIPFAGHPTLGTAAIIREKLMKSSPEEIILDLPAGEYPVVREGESYWMTQKQPRFGKTLNQEKCAAVLNLPTYDIDGPVTEVSTGLPFIIVPLKSLESVQMARVHTGLLSSFAEDLEAKAFCIFCKETADSRVDLHVRVFADLLMIPEDPATGSAAGGLTAYLLNRKIFGESFALTVEQGLEIGRPSRLYLKGEKKEEFFSIRVGGKVTLIGEGHFY